MNTAYLRVRGVGDRIVAALMLLVTSPLMGIVCVAILIGMGRPVLFRQGRIGRGGRGFRILKFRTMVPDAAERGGGYMPAELDLVPPLGRLLRRASLDELPQLVNILRGEMSFVGPRPALPEQYRRYDARRARRVLVPQGVTGLAQVRYRNNAPWSLRIESDLEYVEHVSPGLDALILLRTFTKVARGDGVLLGQVESDVDDLG